LKKSFLTVAFTEWMQIGLISIFITAFCGLFSLLLAVRYLNFHPYFFDAVSYSFYNIRLLELVRLDGAWPVAWQEISGNNRHPLRTVPLILFSPSLLGHPFGHVPFALLALLIFLCLLGWVTLQTTKSKPLSALVVLAAGCMPGIFQPWTGISAYWLDLVAALLMGAALLSLVRFGSGGGIAWLALAGFFGAGACLSRYIAAGYLFFAGGPAALLVLWARARATPRPWRAFLIYFLLLAGSGGVLAGPFLLSHASSVAEFYRTYGYALGAPLGQTLHALRTSAGDFLAPTGVVFLALGGLLKAWHHFRSRGSLDACLLGAAVWLALAVPIFLIFVIRAATGHTVAFAVVCWWAALLMPWGRSTLLSPMKGLVRVVAPTTAALIFGGWVWQYGKEWREAARPSAEATGMRLMQTQLADELTRDRRPLVWNAYFGEVSWIPALDAYYRHGILPIPLGQDYVFSVHESVYRGNFPGWPLKRIQEFLYNNAVQHLEIAVILEDFTHAERTLPEPTGRAVAEFMSRRIHEDPQWEKIFEMENEYIGRLGGYKNIKSSSEAFQQTIKREIQLKPKIK
jgi:hypothetical protein